MEEDSDDKIRRNLIVVSTAVLVGAWLELPAASVMKRVLGDDISATVQPWRLWAAVLAMLFYLALRYRFSLGAPKAWYDARSELQRFRLSAMDAVLVREVKRYTKRGVESTAFFGELTSHIKSRMGVRPTRPVITFTKITHHGSGKGEAAMNLAWPAEKVGDSSDTPVGFELGKADRLVADARALLRLLSYSDASTSLLVPVTLTVLAIAISACRLIQSLV
jgi:hypothetical protein